MVIRKRCLLWDYTNTNQCPQMMDKVDFKGPIHSVHNWNAWYPQELKHRAPFRPMVHLEAQLSGQDWQFIQNTNETVIHYFNEPERAGISPQRAADLWHEKMVPLHKKGKKLVSPSCSNDQKGQAWIADFLNRVKDHPPHYLGLHYYGTKASEAIAFIESMHRKFPKYPIIVSEIACISREYRDVKKFTVQVTNWMDRQKFVAEYGWFGCMQHVPDNFVSPAAQLMNPDGSFKELMRKLMHEQPMKE